MNGQNLIRENPPNDFEILKLSIFESLNQLPFVGVDSILVIEPVEEKPLQFLVAMILQEFFSSKGMMIKEGEEQNSTKLTFHLLKFDLKKFRFYGIPRDKVKRELHINLLLQFQRRGNVSALSVEKVYNDWFYASELEGTRVEGIDFDLIERENWVLNLVFGGLITLVFYLIYQGGF